MSGAVHWSQAEPSDFAVIGDPVSHSLSPRMHQAAFTHLGLPYRYVALHVPQDEVLAALDCLAGLGYRGVNVTVPNKAQALAWSERPDADSVRLGAANTIRLADRSCTNTDLPGFWDTLEGLDLPNRRALVLGAGGSARSVIVALATHGFEIGVWNRTRSNADSMLDMLGVEASVLVAPSFGQAALVVNTTASSLQGERIHVDWPSLTYSAVAYDLMYAPQATPFLQEAQRHGCRTIDGRPLLAAQGARSLEYWLDIDAPRDVMLRAIQPPSVS